MLFYRAALPVSRSTLTYLTGLIRRHRHHIGSLWRKPTPGQQALLVLVHLRKGETPAQVAAGFGIGTATAHRSPTLDQALRTAQRTGYPFVVPDGTFIPINRVAADRPYYSGKHKMHGMNIQVIATPDGTPLWTSGSLPGSVHGLKAARIRGIIRRLAASGLKTLADKGHIGAGEPVLVPYKGRGKPQSQKTANSAHAKLRAPGERANAQLKTWKILTKLRCCPLRAGQLVKAVLVLQARETR